MITYCILHEIPVSYTHLDVYKRQGDSIDLGYANLNSRRGRVGHQIAHTLTTGVQQGTLHFVDLSPPPVVTEECRSLNTRQCGVHKYKGECSGVLAEDGARAVSYTHLDVYKRQGIYYQKIITC